MQLRNAIAIALVASSACTCGRPIVAEVHVSPDASYTSCVRVFARTAGKADTQASLPVLVDAGQKVTVAIFQGALGQTLEVWAGGFEGTCQSTEWSEWSAVAGATFGSDQVVQLQLNGAPCITGDPSRSCDDGNACTVPDMCRVDKTCGGPANTCVPPVCHWPIGCNPSTGCLYEIDAGVACSDGDACTGPDSCNLLGECAGAPHPCPSNACVARTCNGIGGCAEMFFPLRACPDGLCGDAGSCHAFGYTPSNFTPVALAAQVFMDGGIALRIDCAAVYDTTGAGTWVTPCNGVRPLGYPVAQATGPELMVMPLGALTITSGESLQVRGARPLLLAVYGDAFIDGTLNASSVGNTGGAGRDPAGLCVDAGNGTGNEAGGGGGGFGSDGGAGGPPGPPPAGLVSGGPTLVPLRGGCGGGRGNGGGGAQGGFGGGAVQVSVAGRLVVGPTGTVASGGAGGRGAAQNDNGGGGGGSGGAVFLEARDVLVSNGAALTANGGGGGEGSGPANDGDDGNDGSATSATPAAGGTMGSANGGKGGDGAAGTTAAEDGEDTGGGSGGGGGGLGRIRINGSSSCKVDAGVRSPAPTYGGMCP